MQREISEIEQNYQHAVVRDLAWAIASPPLMLPAAGACEWFDHHWYQQRYQDSSRWLEQLDRDPAPLQMCLDAQKDRRLGSYFETLWAFWLEADARFDLIARNLPIRDGGATLGELDFIIRDNLSGLNYHWEVAVKFYLGVADTQQLDNWHGPGKRDRLDIKLDHLRDRQSVICQLPQTQAVLREMEIDVAGCAVILKGRLFYPAMQEVYRAPRGACARHLKNQWYRLADFVSSAAADDWYRPLIRAGWMSDHAVMDRAECYRLDDLLAALRAGVYRLPLYLIRMRGEESHRLFVVPDDWDQQL